MGKLKIFLSYHKNTPLYKSDVFEPVQAGAAVNDIRLGMITDNTGDNISHLNPYYCELTAYYYVLKNYLDTCDEDYIGFAHYRRLVDLTRVSSIDSPAIYGLNHSNSIKVFESFKDVDLAEKCEPYDIILPCSAYMYRDTVNPELRSNEVPIDMYNQFKIEHKNDLMDVLKDVITEKYPDYKEGMNYCFNSVSAHFYNIYIMKKDILREFLMWEFDLLQAVSDRIGGWESSGYKRMAGFIGERLINIWLRAHQDRNYKTGFVPVYMIDFESEYINNANAFDYIKRYDLEIEELKHLLEITSDKFPIYSAILALYLKLNDFENAEIYLKECEQFANNADNYLALAHACEKYTGFVNYTISFYEQALNLEPLNIFAARNFLVFSNRIHNIECVKQAWDYILSGDVTPAEQQEYENFMRTYSLVHGRVQ